MSGMSVIELFAGTRPDGRPVAERLQVLPQSDDSLVVARSPAFIQGLARGDRIKLNASEQSFELLQRGGNLCIRVIVKDDIDTLASDLTPLIEKMGGDLDLQTERMLVFTVHVSFGFSAIENLLNDLVGEETDSLWYYGNVYDPQDGVTPLNWWQEILKPQ